MSFWKQIGNSIASSALATASEAFKAGAGWQSTGLAAAIGAIGGLLQSLLTHQAAQHPVVAQASAQVAKVATGTA